MISSSHSKSRSVSSKSPSNETLPDVRRASARAALRRKRVLHRVELLAQEELVEVCEVKAEQRVELPELFVESIGQLLEYRIRLFGRFVVADLDQPLQRRQLVVQTDRIVERILTASISILIDFALDRGQLFDERVCRRLDGGVVGFPKSCRDLILHAPNSEHGLVCR